MPDLLSLATLPLRLTGRVAGVALRPVAGIAEQALDWAGELLGGGGEPTSDAYRPANAPTNGGGTRAGAGTIAPEAPAERPAPGAAPAADPPPAFEDGPEPSAVEAAGAGPIPDAAVDEPEHVSEEPVLVAESADPEVADGVHTDFHVQEPWEGYAKLRAPEVIAALADRTSVELAVARLYESTHRARRTVLEAADRELARR